MGRCEPDIIAGIVQLFDNAVDLHPTHRISVEHVDHVKAVFRRDVPPIQVHIKRLTGKSLGFAQFRQPDHGKSLPQGDIVDNADQVCIRTALGAGNILRILVPDVEHFGKIHAKLHCSAAETIRIRL